MNNKQRILSIPQEKSSVLTDGKVQDKQIQGSKL